MSRRVNGSDPGAGGGGGGGTHSTGTLASRPSGPAAGDTYAVTSGAAKGDRYQCFVATTWTLVRADEIGGFAPTLRWKLDETAGTTAANSGTASSADLTYAGSPRLGAPVGPRGGRGAYFSADTKYAHGYSTTPTSSTAFSTFALVDLIGSTGGFQPVVVRRLATPGEPFTWYLGFINDSVTLYYRTAAAGSYATLATATNYVAPGVHTVGATWNGGTVKIYLDGVEVGTASPGSTLLWSSSGSPEWEVAATGTSGERINGSISDVQIYDGTALSAGDVAELHARALGTYEGQ